MNNQQGIGLREFLPGLVLTLLLIVSVFWLQTSPVAAVSESLQVGVETEKFHYLSGESLNITVLVTNLGPDLTLHFPSTCQATFIVMDSSGIIVYDNQLHADCFSGITELQLIAGQGFVYTFTWNQVDDVGNPVPAPQSFTIRGDILSNEPVPSGSAGIQVRVGSSEISVEGLVASRGFAYSQVTSQPVTVTVTVTNSGLEAKTLQVELRAEGMTVESQAAGFGPGETRVLAFSWTPHLLPRGRFSLSAQASTTALVSSVHVGPVFTIRLAGDTNNDCTVNILDLVLVGASFMATPSSSNWKPEADLNNDLVVNILDVVVVGANFLRVCPPNVDITQGSDPNNRQQVEPTIAVHPLKPEIVVAGAQDLRLVALGKNRWHGYYRSTDGGQTWSVSLLPGYPGDSSIEGQSSPLKGSLFTSDPVLAIDRLGTVYYAGLVLLPPTCPICTDSVYRIFVARYINDGATYDGVAVIQDPSFGFFQDKPWIAVDNTGGPNDGNVYVVWDGIVDGVFTSVLSRSTDHGLTFSPPIRVPSLPTSTFLPFVTVGPEGNIFVSTVNEFISSILVSRSTDGGLSFATVTAVSGITSAPSPLPGNGFRMFTIPQIAADENAVYVVWDDYRTGDADVLLSRSTDGGLTWTSPARVNDVDTGEQFFGSVSASAGVVSVVYYDARFDDGGTITDLDLFLSRSTNAGGTFLPGFRITSQSFDPNLVRRTVEPDAGAPFLGDYIQVVSTPGRVYVIWADNRNVIPTADANSGRLDQDVFVSTVSF